MHAREGYINLFVYAAFQRWLTFAVKCEVKDDVSPYFFEVVGLAELKKESTGLFEH